MSEKPQTGPNIQAFAKRIEEATSQIDFIGRDGKPRKRDYEDEARWYTAYHIAENMRADYTSKDWAHYVMEGMQPLTDEEVREWFQESETSEPVWPSREELIRWFHG